MSTIGKEYKLAIRIAGIVDKSFNASLTSTQGSLVKFKTTINAMDKDFAKLDKGFNKIMSAGQKCFSVIATAAGVATVAVGAATAAAISVGSDFESAFAGVKKTVDATEEEYEQLRQNILDMTKEIPSSASEIAGVMEIAGQLGIVNESLTDFTETMINLGVSTNLAAEDAATALARFANIMSMEDYGEDGISNFERLGSAVVDLGNNFATTESEIVDIAESLAAAGKLANMSEADIMGISAAMSSVGLTADSGASSMSRLIMQMQQAVAEGGGDLAGYAEAVGMTSEQFAELFRSDAAGAVTAFIGGLNAAGEDSYGILEDLDLSTIRLRKSFLSLAGADDLMGNAIKMSNEAWNENTALAIEAGKRYETAESQVQLMKNAFSELAITAYDDLREPFVSVINTITEEVQGLTEYVGGPDGISEWLKNIGTELPTLQRKFKKYGEPVFSGIVNVGKWIVKHGNGIISMLAGIGAAMATYKIASTLTHIVKALMTLGGMSPVTLTILGIVAAVGALTTAIAAYKQHENELIDNNLADHFGNIALSMEEIQAVAEHIVGTDSLGAVKEALGAFDDLDTISGTIENALSEINKMNWKVSIGMELTEDEQESYKATIQEYVSAAQKYASQSQYAVSLNLSADGETSDIDAKINQFYADSYDEMVSLGTQLSDAVNEAFADNVLSADELSEIIDMQSQMAELQSSLATGEYDAQLSLLTKQYGSLGELDADTFKNLMEEVQTQIDTLSESYGEAYSQTYAAAQAALDAGYISENEFNTEVSDAYDEYVANLMEAQSNAIDALIDTISAQYPELKTAIQEYRDSMDEMLDEYSTRDWENGPVLIWEDLMTGIADSSTLDGTTKEAISQLLDLLYPTVEQQESLLNEYKELGKEIPDSVLEGVSDYNMLNALTAKRGWTNDYSKDDLSSIGSVIGEEMVNSGLYDSIYQDIINNLNSMEYEVPESVTNGITSAAAAVSADNINSAAEAVVKPAVEGMYAWSQETIDDYYSKGFTAKADVSITLNPTLNGLNRYTGISSLYNFPINQRANGGLATSPELTWFAEKGPEMAIPIDGSKNAISLWEQTGRLLGMDSAFDGLDLNGDSSPTIEYSPTLQFYGEAPSKDDMEDALRISEDEFERLMEKYFKTHGRVSFG